MPRDDRVVGPRRKAIRQDDRALLSAPRVVVLRQERPEQVVDRQLGVVTRPEGIQFQWRARRRDRAQIDGKI